MRTNRHLQGLSLNTSKKVTTIAAIVVSLLISACSTYSTQQGADDFFDGAITNTKESQTQSPTAINLAEPSAKADPLAGLVNIGFGWIRSLFVEEKNQ